MVQKSIEENYNGKREQVLFEKKPFYQQRAEEFCEYEHNPDLGILNFMMKNYKPNHRRLWQQRIKRKSIEKKRKLEEERALQEKFI